MVKDWHILFLMLISLMTSCGAPNRENQPIGDKQLRNYLESANRILIESERQEIVDMIARHNWQMQESETGLWYQIYARGTGRRANPGDIAVIHYSISLATGDLIYSSNPQEPKQFRVGKGGVETGLEEGILKMSIGDKARFVLPSHLAHGVPGDGARIPARATIVYDVELLDLLNAQ
ncbi:MAG TPA: peptidylprolyl isomerase [Bacteroidales bacterium]|nr:peptidylprolyl isomerase [Bacteroidales bacterium]